jgi:hypothetical protein
MTAAPPLVAGTAAITEQIASAPQRLGQWHSLPL